MKDYSNYATHLPLLIKSIEATDKPILELGMGISTMIIHMMCKTSGRKIVSIESDPKWYEENLVYKSDNHALVCTKDLGFLDNYDDWGVILVDHRPAIDRKTQAVRFKDKADIILVHDSEPEIDRFYGYSRIYKHFKYVYHYTRCKPFTTALSNKVDVSTLFNNNPVKSL